MDFKKDVKCELYNDHFQNYKRYNIPEEEKKIKKGHFYIPKKENSLFNNL